MFIHTSTGNHENSEQGKIPFSEDATEQLVASASGYGCATITMAPFGATCGCIYGFVASSIFCYISLAQIEGGAPPQVAFAIPFIVAMATAAGTLTGVLYSSSMCGPIGAGLLGFGTKRDLGSAISAIVSAALAESVIIPIVMITVASGVAVALFPFLLSWAPIVILPAIVAAPFISIFGSIVVYNIL